MAPTRTRVPWRGYFYRAGGSARPGRARVFGTGRCGSRRINIVGSRSAAERRPQRQPGLYNTLISERRALEAVSEYGLGGWGGHGSSSGNLTVPTARLADILASVALWIGATILIAETARRERRGRLTIQPRAAVCGSATPVIRNRRLRSPGERIGSLSRRRNFAAAKQPIGP
jgi:hypothetical protein